MSSSQATISAYPLPAFNRSVEFLRKGKNPVAIRKAMKLCTCSLSSTKFTRCDFIVFSKIRISPSAAVNSFAFSSFSLSFRSRKGLPQPIALSRTRPRSHSLNGGETDDPEALVQDLRVPVHWLTPSKALEESEWLRVTLHKWLDDEYCPEQTNVEISKVAAASYYRCLIEKKTDVGEILLRMATELESISYQDSFHGAFSSANAAVSLIVQRLFLD